MSLKLKEKSKVFKKYNLLSQFYEILFLPCWTTNVCFKHFCSILTDDDSKDEREPRTRMSQRSWNGNILRLYVLNVWKMFIMSAVDISLFCSLFTFTIFMRVQDKRWVLIPFHIHFVAFHLISWTLLVIVSKSFIVSFLLNLHL